MNSIMAKTGFLGEILKVDIAEPLEYAFYSDQAYHKLIANFAEFRTVLPNIIEAGIYKKTFHAFFFYALKELGQWLSGVLKEEV